jgi:branched-chain amino acid transport system ATP-binding protein
MSRLEVERLSARFGGVRAVRDLSFAAEQGEILGLIGPNGAGKTTVFNLVTGFVRPTGGEVRLDGVVLTGRKPHAVTRQGVARTFQVVKPFPGLSVRENVTLAAFLRRPVRRDAEARAGEVLGQVGLAHRADEPAGQLTLIDQKRLEVARALATDPRVLLLDEPMGGLTPAEVDVAVALVLEVRAGGVTVILVEHVMKAILRISDRVVVMSQGEKIAEGPPAAVVEDPAVRAAYFGRREP